MRSAFDCAGFVVEGEVVGGAADGAPGLGAAGLLRGAFPGALVLDAGPVAASLVFPFVGAASGGGGAGAEAADETWAEGDHRS